MKLLLLIGLACLFAALPATAGTLYFSQDDNSNGLYTLNTTTGLATQVGITDVDGSTAGLALGDQPGTLFASRPFGIGRVNTDGSGAAYMPDSTVAEGLEYAGGTLYGVINGEFFTIDTTTGLVATTLAAPDADVEGLAYGNGVIYGLAGWSGPRGNLYKYDIGLDLWSLLGFTGVEFNVPGLAFDSDLGILYAIGSQDNNLYSIDPATAVATAIGPTALTDSTGGGLAYQSDTTIPEPATCGLIGAALIGLTFWRRRLTRG
jgi:hypothetical protein